MIDGANIASRINILYWIPRCPVSSWICFTEIADRKVSEHHNVMSESNSPWARRYTC